MIVIRIPSQYWLDTDPYKMIEWQWCKNRFGLPKDNKDPAYWQGSTSWGGLAVFRFKDPQHATMFALRWAQ